MKAVVFMIRGLQASYLGCYGNQWLATPAIDGLAAEGVVFDQHYAEWPEPGMSDLGWSTGGYHFPLSSAASETRPISLSLPAILSRHKIPALRTAGREMAADHAGDGWIGTGRTRRKKIGDSDPEDLPTAAASALKRLAREEQWLLWIDSTALLPPWKMPSQFRDMYFDEGSTEPDEEAGSGEPRTPIIGPLPERIGDDDDALFDSLRFTYGGAVSFVDKAISQVLDLLEAQKLLDEVLLVVMADRGLPLGEHGWVGGSLPAPHEELVHIPLIIRLPQSARAGRRVWGLTQPVDFYCTLLESFGLQAPAVHGSSLVGLIKGEAESIRPYACSGVRFADSANWALRAPHWALIMEGWQPGKDSSGVRRLFVKPDDQWEVNDVVQHHPELIQHMAETLRAFTEAARAPGPIRYPELRDVETSAIEATS